MGILQFCYPDCIPPQKVFNPWRAVVAIVEPHDFGGPAAFFGEPLKVGIGCHDDKPVAPRIIPNCFVPCGARETGVENVGRFGKKSRQAANEFRRQVCVKKKFQRETRFRPVCDA